METNVLMTKNSLGRWVPTEVNGQAVIPYKGYLYVPEKQVLADPHPPVDSFKNKLTTLDAVLEGLRDGDIISYPHMYRYGDKCLEMIIDALRRKRLRGIVLYGNAFFAFPWLVNAIKEGIIGAIYGNVYGKDKGEIGHAVVTGDLPCMVVGFSHGERVRKMETGEIKPKISFIPLPTANTWGEGSGWMGDLRHICGPTGLATADTEYGEQVVLMAKYILNCPLKVPSIPAHRVHHVIQVDNPGESKGIGSGSLDLNRIRAKKENTQIAEQILLVMEAAGIFEIPYFNSQIGSGPGLLVLEGMTRTLIEKRKKGGYIIGGIADPHVDMREQDVVECILHGQLFQPSRRIIESFCSDPAHLEMSVGDYASIAPVRQKCMVDGLHVSVLSVSEVGRQFHCNTTVGMDGMPVGGVGGAPDVAWGTTHNGGVTIVFSPLAGFSKSREVAYPKIVDDVVTVSYPGSTVGVVVTEEYICINPDNQSELIQRLREEGGKKGLKIIPSMDELVSLALKKAESMGKIMSKAQFSERPAGVILYRDGTGIDTIKILAH